MVGVRGNLTLHLVEREIEQTPQLEQNAEVGPVYCFVGLTKTGLSGLPAVPELRERMGASME